MRPPAAPLGSGSFLARVRRLGLPVYCGGPRGRAVALTFDDGPGVYTHYVLEELRRARARATFFLVGRSIRAFPAWPRRELRVAALGDHTATHPYLPHLSRAAVAAEIMGGRDAIDAAAKTTVRLFRPPYGAHDPFVDRQVKRDGMLEVLWSIDSGDSNPFHPQSYVAITRTVERWIRPGSIVLFHDGRGQTVRALRAILPFLRRHHLRPVTVPELLATDPPSPARARDGLRGCGPTPPTIGSGG
jgi:peptidoglycan/xylan/chitin deacetylase (PgdA/CDA1 family)